MIVTPRPSRTLNSIALIVVCGVLVGAYFFQFTLNELPCPLCLLQRVAFVAVGYGLALNLIYGAKPHHYGIMLIAAVYGGSVSIRQILLHIVPGTGSYGSPVLGLHYYTWAGICFFLIILGTSVMLLFEGQYKTLKDEPSHERFGGLKLAKFTFFLLLFLASANAVTTLLECGPLICADPPTDYKLLEDLNKSG
jgi:disulfide bond formation protein DsbB